MTERNQILSAFEESFLSVPFHRQVEHCDKYELVSLFKEWLPNHQPILEAGCGSGRWVAWFKNHGWNATGIDWSERLCKQAQELAPNAKFHVGDMRAMPFPDNSFGSIVALGSVEHDPAGPAACLREFRRVLKDDGIAIVTVPFFNPVRKVIKKLNTPIRILKTSAPVRRFFGKSGWAGRSLASAASDTLEKYNADFSCDETGWSFFQYVFTDAQVQYEFDASGFAVLEKTISFHDEGILHTFGKLSGRYDQNTASVVFSPTGRLLRRLLPIHIVGHMLCYVIRRS